MRQQKKFKYTFMKEGSKQARKELYTKMSNVNRSDIEMEERNMVEICALNNFFSSENLKIFFCFDVILQNAFCSILYYIPPC